MNYDIEGMIYQVEPAEYLSWTQQHPECVLIDVRESWEMDRVALQGCLAMPLSQPAQIQVWAEKLPKNSTLLFYCHHGIRSEQVCRYFDELGFNQVYNLAGGIDSLASILPLSRY